MIITPNFNFNGQCEEALLLYQKAFHGTIGCMLRYSDANPKDWTRPLSQEEAQKIYHSELWIGIQRMMMCDNLEVPFQTSLSLSLVVTVDTKDEVAAAYEILKEGCTLIYPMRQTTYSSCEVVLIDKFGFRWGIMTEQTER